MNEPHPETAAPVDAAVPSLLPTPEELAQRSARASRLSTVVISCVLSLCLSAAALYVYDLKFAQKLLVIDMNAFLNEQRTLLVAGKNGESDRRFDELEAKLNSLPANQVVLLKSVAVRNATEIRP